MQDHPELQREFEASLLHVTPYFENESHGVYTCSSSTWLTDTSELPWVQSHPELHSETQSR